MKLKKLFSIIVLLLTLGMGSVQPVHRALAAETPPQTPKIIKACEEKLPKYPMTDKGEVDDLKIDLSKPYAGLYELNFRIAFEMARTKYHTYMECVFEGVVDEVMGSAGGNTSGIFSAHAPNLPEMLKPESSCIAEEGLTKLLKDGSPAVLLDPLLQEYNRYTAYLQKLYQKLSEKVPAPSGEVKFENIFANNQSLRLLVENEVQDALVALDGAFVGIKEMRQAYVMHIHFQCMLKNLEFYRHALENLRRVIMALPGNIINASAH